MTWTKFNQEDKSTWPEGGVELLWKVILITGEVFNFLTEMDPKVGYPIMFWDKKVPVDGDLYWICIPPFTTE